MKLFLCTLLVLPSLLLADPNMPDSVGYFYLAIYLGFALGALVIFGVVLYIGKILFLKNTLITSDNEQIQDLRLIRSLKIFLILSFLPLIISVGVFYFPDYYFFLYFSDLNFWVFVLTLYILKLVKHKYITVSFIFVCIQMFVAIVSLLEIFEIHFGHEIIELILMGFSFIAKGLGVFNLIFYFLLFPLIILAFKTLSKDETYHKRLKLVLILTITLSILSYAKFTFFDVSESLMLLISILFELLNFGIILYFTQSVLMMFNDVNKIEKM